MGDPKPRHFWGSLCIPVPAAGRVLDAATEAFFSSLGVSFPDFQFWISSSPEMLMEFRELRHSAKPSLTIQFCWTAAIWAGPALLESDSTGKCHTTSNRTSYIMRLQNQGGKNGLPGSVWLRSRLSSNRSGLNGFVRLVRGLGTLALGIVSSTDRAGALDETTSLNSCTRSLSDNMWILTTAVSNLLSEKAHWPWEPQRKR